MTELHDKYYRDLLFLAGKPIACPKIKSGLSDSKSPTPSGRILELRKLSLRTREPVWGCPESRLGPRATRPQDSGLSPDATVNPKG